MNSDRYQIQKISNMFETDMWGIFDMNFVPAEPILDDRKDHATGRKKRQQYWKGTEDAAHHYCTLVNRIYVAEGKEPCTAQNQVSKSQRHHYAQKGHGVGKVHRIVEGSNGGASFRKSGTGASGRSMGTGDGSGRVAGPDLRRRLGIGNNKITGQQKFEDLPPF